MAPYIQLIIHQLPAHIVVADPGMFRVAFLTPSTENYLPNFQIFVKSGVWETFFSNFENLLSYPEVPAPPPKSERSIPHGIVFIHMITKW